MEVHLELMGSIKELPKLERPREKAMHYGLASLSDIELLSLLISTGYKGISALEIATSLITNFHGLSSLANASILDIRKTKGIKDAKALNLAAIFELHKRLSIREKEVEDVEVTPDYLYNKYKTNLLSSHQENLILVVLNKKRKIIHEKTIYVGTEKNMCFSYKDIWRELLNNHGYSFYLIHNHPNSSSTPSEQDIIFTGELFLESDRIGIPMIDHLIVGENGYYSFQNLKK